MTDTSVATGAAASNPLPPLVQTVLGLLARHALTGLAGLIGGAGVALSPDQKTQFISGGVALIIWLAGVILSNLNHLQQRKAVAAAIAAPKASTTTVTQHDASGAVVSSVKTVTTPGANINDPDPS